MMSLTRFETIVRIERPLEEVFAYTSDPLNLPRWNSAVRTVRKTHGRGSEVGSTYAMERELPSGRVHNELEVFAHDHPSEFSIRTTLGPTPFVYKYGFVAEDGETLVRLDAAFKLGGPARLLAPIAGRAVKRGADDNLAALKRILEASNTR
jgi:uncharacterized protein YndB with AHSA1/START domain